MPIAPSRDGIGILCLYLERHHLRHVTWTGATEVFRCKCLETLVLLSTVGQSGATEFSTAGCSKFMGLPTLPTPSPIPWCAVLVKQMPYRLMIMGFTG